MATPARPPVALLAQRLSRAPEPGPVVTVPVAPAATPGTPMAGPVATPTVVLRVLRTVVPAGRRPGLVGPAAARAAAREAAQPAGPVRQAPTRRATRLAVTPPPGPATVVTARVVPQMAAMVLLLLLLALVALGVMPPGGLALPLLATSRPGTPATPRTPTVTVVAPATLGMLVTVPLLLLLLLVVLAATRARVTAVPARPTLARVATRPVVRALPTAARVLLGRAERVEL